MSTFKPKSLTRESVEAPMQPGWRVMGEDEERRLHENALAEHRRYATWNPRFRRRVVKYVVGTAIGFAIAGYLFVLGHASTLLAFAAVGAVLGVIVAWWRPTDFTASMLYVAAGLVGGALAHASFFFTVLGALWLGIVGIIVGRGEEMKRVDFED